MSWVRSLYYTPLIETDVNAYERFIAAVQAHFSDGAGVDFASEQSGASVGQQHNGCVDNTRCCLDRSVARVVVASPDASVGAAGVGAVSSGEHGAVDSGVESRQLCCQSVGGLSVDCAHNSDSCACCCVCSDAIPVRSATNSDDGDGNLGAPLAKESVEFGKWHASNVKKRSRKRVSRFSQSKRALMQHSWRDNAAPLSQHEVDGSRREGNDLKPSTGFFSDCSEEVRGSLRDSRARMLIAQNNLRAEKAKKDLESMNSVQGIVQQMLDVTTSVAKLQKHTADEAVHGWARTVASTMAKSITESSSHVPTLESIGFGASGLKSTDGEVLDPVRVAAYDRDMKYVEDCFASMDGYSEEDYKLAVHRVKLDFPDVAYTKVQREVAASKSVAVERLLELGVSYDKIQLALYPDECGGL